MATSKQASKHTHVQCSLPSVRLTHACPNKVMKINQEHMHRKCTHKPVSEYEHECMYHHYSNTV